MGLSEKNIVKPENFVEEKKGRHRNGTMGKSTRPGAGENKNETGWRNSSYLILQKSLRRQDPDGVFLKEMGALGAGEGVKTKKKKNKQKGGGLTSNVEKKKDALGGPKRLPRANAVSHWGATAGYWEPSFDMVGGYKRGKVNGIKTRNDPPRLPFP